MDKNIRYDATCDNQVLNAASLCGVAANLKSPTTSASETMEELDYRDHTVTGSMASLSELCRI